MFTVKNKILYRRENLITIQKNVRMHLSKVKHRPRYMGIRKINSLKVSLSPIIVNDIDNQWL